MRLRGCDICKNSREPVYYILEELGRMIQRITSYIYYPTDEKMKQIPISIIIILVNCALVNVRVCVFLFPSFW